MGFAEDYGAGPFLSLLDYHGETIEYAPASGASRSVVAIINHSTERQVSEYQDAIRDALRVSLLKDESDSRGGVSEPRIGDSFFRGAGAAYSFDWILRDEPGHWVLRFSRDRRQIAGSGFQA